MEDLNDLLIFSHVVSQNGFTGAAKALGVARSSICRRIAQLETRLGVRLIQRSTRHFSVTEVGRDLHEHCLRMIAEAQAGYNRVACAKNKPSGLLRVSSTPTASKLVGPMIAAFTRSHTEIQVSLENADSRINIEDGYDLWIRLETLPRRDSGMIVRPLGGVHQVLVGSPCMLARYGTPNDLSDLSRLPTLDIGPHAGTHTWSLQGPDSKDVLFRHEPRLVADDLSLIQDAAIQGLGMALLPLPLCTDDICRDRLRVVLPNYRASMTEVQVLFASRRGMLPGTRSLIDFLCVHCSPDISKMGSASFESKYKVTPPPAARTQFSAGANAIATPDRIAEVA